MNKILLDWEEGLRREREESIHNWLLAPFCASTKRERERASDRYWNNFMPALAYCWGEKSARCGKSYTPNLCAYSTFGRGMQSDVSGVRRRGIFRVSTKSGIAAGRAKLHSVAKLTRICRLIYITILK